MTDIITYLEESALVANVLGVIALGFMGYLVKAIIGAVADLATNTAELKETLSIYERLNKVENMSYLQAKLYKDAVIGSNLDVDIKNLILADWADIEAAHTEYLDGVSVQEVLPEATSTTPTTTTTLNPVLSSAVSVGTAFLAKEATTILDKLKDQIDNVDTKL